jgi:hypothetical protein
MTSQSGLLAPVFLLQGPGTLNPTGRRTAIFATYSAELGGVLHLTCIILTRVIPSNDARNIAIFVSLS